MKKKILFTLLTILLSPSLWAQEDLHWQCDPHAYKFDMTANVVLQVSDATLTDYANYEVAAFCNDECRGIAAFQKVGDTQTQVGYLRIYSKDITGDKITFKAYDKLRQKEMIIPDTVLTFAEDETHGLPSKPLTLVAYYLFDVTTVANGQGTVKEGGVVREGNSITLTATPDEGYHFVSWTAGGTVVSTEASFTYKPENDVILTANFAAIVYTITYELDGGTLDEGVTNPASYTIESETFTLNNPSRTGYTFRGWLTDLAEPAAELTIAKGSIDNRSYKAVWEVNSYTMTFVLGNGEENVVKTQAYGTPLSAPEGLTKPGYSFAGWNPEVPTTTPATDQTYTAQWEAITYQITYELNGGAVSEANPTTYTIETEGFTLNNPTRDGYDFLGWEGTGLTELSATVAVAKGSTGDRAYTALWKAKSVQITFEWEGGKQVSTLEYGEVLTAPTPEREGYSFAGWNPEVPTTTPATAQTYTAQWEAITYQITYVLNGGAVSEANPTTYTIETDSFTLNNPTRDGYDFLGWESADLVGSNPTVIIAKGSTGDRTYTAIWSTESYTISYDLDNGKLAAGVANPTTYSYESDAITLNNPTREGYTFLGWTGTGLTEATKDVTIPQHSSGNRSYKATWQINKHIVTFIDHREGFENKVIKTDELEFGTAIEFPTEELEWEGHVFIAWQADKAPGEGGTVPDYDLTYYSAWDALKLTLSYEIDGEAYGGATQVAYGADIQKKPDPAPREGYTFSGWKGFPETGKMPAYDLVIRGAYIPIEYSITYNLADGKLAAGVENPTTYTIESADITLKNPSRTGYTFVGWTGTGLDEAAATVTIDKGSMGNRTYTATWTAEEYNMTFVLGNGEDNVVKTQAYTSELTAPENLQRTGYTFSGWIPEVPATVPVGDQTFTAQWTINSYKLQFMVDGQAVSEASVVYEGTFDTPKDPEKPGYTFKDWDAEIPEKMPAADLTFNAVFEAIVYTITYDLDGGTLDEGVTNPASYTIENETFTLNNPSRTGYTFRGWLSTDLAEPAAELTIAKGSTGNRSYKADWEVNSYSLTFVLNNGEENLVITQNYQTTVNAPADPTKTGYTFAGWDQEIPTTMPAGDMTINATWTINQYTITFDIDGGSEVAAITQDYATAITAPAPPTKTGYTFAGWQPILPETMPAENTTIKAQWTINQYTITFDADGGSEVEAITQDYATAITAPAAPTKTGYTFAGWQPILPETMPAENTSVKAQWTANQYTITFDTDGGSEVAAITQDYATAITAPANPTKMGYVFLGWDKLIPETMPAEDMTIKAQWLISQFTITFDTDGGTAVAPITQNYATAITAPAAPTKTGYTFAGWQPVLPEIMPAENTTVKAQWTINQYTITFDTDGGSEVAAITQDYATAITAPANPTKTGYTFDGWDQEIPETMPAGDMTIKATWIINQYTITFDTDGGSEVAAITQDYGTTITAPAAPTKTGYAFLGWDQAIPETMPAGDMTIKAQWLISQYTITFDTDGGSEVAAITQDYATAITAPAAPTKTGYTFDGWDQEIPATMPAEDMTIKALWTINTYKLTYLVDGEEYKTVDVTFADNIAVEAEPTKEGYTFSGWSEVPETMPAQNVTITGTFSINTYKVIYLIDGEEYKTVDVTFAETVTVEAEPTKEGYTFSGWSEAPETMPAQDVTITGTFTVNQYKLIYVVDGEEYDSLYVNYGEPIVLKPEPQKEGRAFSGWSEIPATMPADSVVISGGFAYVISYYDEEDVLYATDTLFYGEEIVKPDYTPKDPERFTFLGWQGEEVDTMPDHDLVFKAKLNDGITGIEADEDDSAIYSVNGAKLRNHATPKDIRSLPRGTYIIRGKKVLIR